jgi:hypothetical protein
MRGVTKGEVIGGSEVDGRIEDRGKEMVKDDKSGDRWM